MPKRRRERDRPKAGHDAPYNPNKRILLSYDSDERDEHELTPDATLDAPASADAVNDTVVASCTEDPRQVRADTEASAYVTDSTKLASCAMGTAQHEQVFEEETNINLGHAEEQETPRLSEEDIGGTVPPDTKGKPRKRSKGISAKILKTLEQAVQFDEAPVSQDKINAYEESGLKPMFLPDMAKVADDDVEDGYDSETDEAMAYLAAVQNERRAIPSVLTASKHTEVKQHDSAEAGTPEDQHVATLDGAYAAQPPPDSNVPTEGEEYIHSIITGYCQVRDLLNEPPTDDEIVGSHETIFIHEIPFGNKEFNCCIRLIRNTAPSMLQIKEMNTETAWELLELVIMRFCLNDNQNISQTLGWWLYLLLARFQEKVDLSMAQIETLRALAKRAVRVRASVKNSTTQTANDGQPDMITETAVDTILIIVGSFYGQRDLLEYRVWPPVLADAK